MSTHNLCLYGENKKKYRKVIIQILFLSILYTNFSTRNIFCCPFDISRKDVFCLAFYFEWKYFVLIDHIQSETICLFCFSVLLSNIYSKIKFTAKNWSDLCNFYSKVIFWSFCLRKYFLLFFAEFKLLMFHNNIVKLSEKLNKRNLLKICFQVTYPTDFCKIRIHFYYRKKWKYLIFLKSNE